MPVDDLRRRHAGVLLAKLRETKYPSPTMLDRIEASITDRRTAEEYVNELIGRIEQDQYPSPPLVDRVQLLLAML
jgi:hypothetical protein